MSNLRRNGQLRWAPSYLRNRGQVTRAQKRALREWWPHYGISFEHGKRINLRHEFDHDGPLLIEIGFGMGEHLLHLAKSLPDHRLLGIEVHRPGLAAVTGKIHEAALTNVRLIRGDARLVLTDHLFPGIASAVMIQFPDPWPKQGDEHRRLVQPGMVKVIHDCLLPNGELLIATDVTDYATHCRSVLSESKGWEERSTSELQSHRIQTRYEQKGLNEGRKISELIYRRID